MAVNSSKKQSTLNSSWPTLDEREVYSGYRTIIRRRYRLPNNQEADFDLIKGKGIVCTLALTSDKQVVLARQFRAGPNKVLAELPGGGIENGEEPIKAAARELAEETGYSGNFQLVAHTPTDAYSTAHRYHFVATNCQLTGRVTNDEHEFTEVVLLPLADFRLHLHSGQLTDIGTGYLGLDFLDLL